MRKFLKYLIAASFLWIASNHGAHAQASVALWCFNPTGSQATNNQYLPCNATTPLQVTIAGSGGGGVAVFGPTASGSASANPPVQVGGTSTGAAGATVQGAAVKPASTAAVSTDTSLVTQLNPLSPGIIALGQATKANSVPVAWASDTVGTAGTPNATVVSVQGESGMTPIVADPTNGYPTGATAETISATGTTAATTATLAAASSKTTYICGFSIRANATAAVTGTATVTGVITGTLSFVQWTAPLASGIGLVEEQFEPCVPASGTNQSIAVVSAAPGSGGTVSVAAWGFQK